MQKDSECPRFESFIAEAIPEKNCRKNFFAALARQFSERFLIQKPPLPARPA